LGLIANHLTRKGESRFEASVALMLLILIIPAAWVGLIKLKFSIFIGIAMVVAAVCALASLERLFIWLGGIAKLDDVAALVRTAFIAILILMVFAELTMSSDYTVAILSKSFTPRYQDDPAALMPKMASTCDLLRAQGYDDPNICAAGYNESYADSINTQFNQEVCVVSLLTPQELLPGNSSAAQQASENAKAGASFRCNRLTDYWVDSMQWISNNTPNDARVTSWWDYGHWINFFGERDTVLRNEQASQEMIGRVAYDYIIGSDQDLISSMNYFDSQYIIFDEEIIGGINGQPFGDKYGALNYLACAHAGLTNVNQTPGSSQCEVDHNPEQIVIPTPTAANTCTISESQQLTGVLAYPYGINGVDQQNPVYCVGEATLADGEKIPATYYLNESDSNGDLVLNKGFIRVLDQDSSGTILAEMVYNNSVVWPGPNGTVVDGMSDAKTAFYTSNLYQAFFNGNLPGFTLAYETANGEVKIYKMDDSLFVGNKAGVVNQTEASKPY
jgi:hypothetical protein